MSQDVLTRVVASRRPDWKEKKSSTRTSGEKVITPHLDSVVDIYVCLWGQQKISVGRRLERLCMKMRIKTRKRIETYLFRFFQYASDNSCRYRNLTAVVFHLLEATCNFDVSLCGFVQGTDDKFDWTRRKGNTPSSGTGPSFDHTTGNMTGEL